MGTKLYTLLLVLFLLAGTATAQVNYIDADGSTQTYNGAITEINSNQNAKTLSTGWYLFSDEWINDGTLTVSGEVHIILADDCNVTVNGTSGGSYGDAGINVSDANSLTIYAQSTGVNMGKLTVTSGANTSGYYQSAGIGGSQKGTGNGGIITINGGEITACSAPGSNSGYGAGIGSSGDSWDGSGTITINGGVIKAYSSYAYNGHGAGIGSGTNNSSNNGIINITGGTIKAYSSGNYIGYGAGIGGGRWGSHGGTINITGGEIEAYSSGNISYGAGIGGGGNSNNNGVITGSTISIDYTGKTDASVTAKGRQAFSDAPNQLINVGSYKINDATVFTEGDYEWSASHTTVSLIPVRLPCGDKLYWTIDGSTLTISGTGPMWNFGYGEAPWYPHSENLTTLVLEEGMTSIGARAFYNCSGFTDSLTIPESLSSIGEYAFVGCSGFTGSLTIPGNIGTIGEYAFVACSGFTGSLTIPGNIETIGEYVFNACSNLETVTFEGDVVIGEYAFAYCSNLTQVTFEDDATIGRGAFINCKNLETVTFEGNAEIEGSAFNNLGNLKTVTFEGNAEIGVAAFYICGNLETVTFKGDATIGNYAFYMCSNLTSLSISAAIPPVIPADVFGSDYISSATLYVPCASVDDYAAATGWSGFGIKAGFDIEIEATANEDTFGSITGDGVHGCSDEVTLTAIPTEGYLFVNWTEGDMEISTANPYTFTAAGDRTLTANFALAPSNDATLSTLTVSAGTLSPTFTANTTAYTVSVENSVSSITIAATANHANATVTGTGAKTLSVGPNPFDIIVTAEDGVTTKTYTVIVIRKPSEDANLSALTVSAGTLSPTFAANTTAYTVTVENSVSNITIAATANHANATIVGTEAKTLSVGPNPFDVVVTAEDGVTTKTYTVIVTRKPSEDANLSALTVSAGTLSPTFAANTTAYTVSVENSISSITIAATANHADATVIGTGAKTLSVGANPFDVVVTAEDGMTTKTYTVIVTRKPSEDANLSALTVSAGTLSPTFAANTTAYTVSVENSISSITIAATANHANATVTGTGAKALSVGPNPFDIIVTAEDGVTTKTYTVIVTRKPSEDVNLSALTVSAGTLSPTFAANTTAYTVTVENNVSNITIAATANHANATVTGTGAKTLSVGPNPFDIIVTAEDGVTTKTYTVIVTRKPSEDANLSALTVSAGTLSPTFAANTTAYTVSVENNVSDITIAATVNHANATVIGTGAKTLNVGANPFEIVVTAEDGVTTKTYTVIVTRKPSNDATLSALTVSAGTLSPTFTANTTAYTVTVENNVNSITIAATANHANATVTGTGAKTLSVGANPFDIVVTAEDGVTTKTYTVIVTRETDVNIENVEPNKVEIYLDPATNHIHVKGLKQASMLSVYNLYGKASIQQEVQPDDSVSVDNLPAGVYLVHVGGTTAKVIKNR